MNRDRVGSTAHPSKRMFLVGRRDRKATTVWLLRRTKLPIAGPWRLAAVVAANGS